MIELYNYGVVGTTTVFKGRWGFGGRREIFTVVAIATPCIGKEEVQEEGRTL